MCGLAGRFHATALPAAPTWAARADAVLAHRGPDGRGCWADRHCQLVHRRLALLDLTPTGSQPLANEDGSVLVVYNGEIYNHQPLREHLRRRGHYFRGTSDTEVLVHLYEEHAERMVDHLRGIFAFALYDVRRRRLMLARDRFGVKPLYYARHEGEWLFASEIKAILARDGFRSGLDRQACYDFLGLGYVPEPATGYTDVHCLPPAGVLCIDGTAARLTEYYRPTVRLDDTPDLADARERLGDQLQRAVRDQLVADVPVAALLSGGIDSSLVVAAQARSGPAATTFNVRFPDTRYDETANAVAVARHCGTVHHTLDLQGGGLDPDTLLDLLRHFDQPFADPSLVPMYLIARCVREHGIICTLCGDGGDEAFGGYPMFVQARPLMHLGRLLQWIGAANGDAEGWVAAWAGERGRQVSRAVTLARAGRRSDAELIAGLLNYLNESQKHALVREEARADLLPVHRLFESSTPTSGPALERLSLRMTEALFAVSLPGNMLKKVDMMSMLAGIEARVPLLDEEIVTLGLSLSHGLKVRGRRGKRVMRSLARQWLPRGIARGHKRGFSAPLRAITTPSFHDMLGDMFGPGARTGPLLDRNLLQSWLGGFRTGRLDAETRSISRGGLHRRIFTLLSLELWMREGGLSW